MHCKDCKHGVAAEHFLGGLACVNPKFKYGYTHDSVPNDAALIENDEGWGWRVGANFGCVLFAPKP